MILKFGSEPHEVFFIQSTSNFGVSLTRWSAIRHEVGHYYTKIALRHLDWERSDQSLAILEQFIKETEGAAFDFRFDQLRLGQSSRVTPFRKVEEEEE